MGLVSRRASRRPRFAPHAALCALCLSLAPVRSSAQLMPSSAASSRGLALARPSATARGALTSPTAALASAPAPLVIVPRASPSAWAPAGPSAPGSPAPAGHAEPATPRRSFRSVARVVLGLLAVLALALLAAHPRVRDFEKRAGFGMIAATGIPFFALGVIAHSNSVGVLSDEVLTDLRPALEFGLGWLGFRVGIEFDVRALDRLPRGAARLLVGQSVAAFLAVAASSAALMALLGGELWDGKVLRDALVLGACAAVSAPTGARALLGAGVLSEGQSRLLRRVAVLGDGVSLAVLALVAGAFRPMASGAWRLPPLGWVFLQVGMGAALGALTVVLVRATKDMAEEVALTFGAVAFTAGMAGYLGFSPLVVGAVAGLVAANSMSGESSREFNAALRGVERPIYMIFFAMAGAGWSPSDRRGWVVVPLFVLARLAAKFLATSGILAAPRGESPDERASDEAVARDAGVVTVGGLPLARYVATALVPTSAMSVATVVSARQSYGASLAPYLETVVIASALVGELLLQMFARAMRRPDAPGFAVVYAENEAGAAQHDSPTGPMPSVSSAAYMVAASPAAAPSMPFSAGAPGAPSDPRPADRADRGDPVEGAPAGEGEGTR